ncbi:acyloxyacyl hydrolase [Thalassotalea mangrovi]|uniref:Acyloxyacyl hydrolase n=1 Tax=Thalassotalea mangrovi TaxID=2572245 RepID=A0A4U1B6L4_9GAMM|nr:acyloxyacyl hydrolase [Thalassotalea mangrovi]TKB46098.1 acyloxyacyl hydrolase [Thalassotalea mangrovi]
MPKFLFLSRLLCLYFLSTFACKALEPNLSLSYAYPSSAQNIDIEKVELSYLFKEKSLTQRWPIYHYPVVNLGQLHTSDGRGEMLGGGLGLATYLTDKFKFNVEGGMYWLSDYQFGEPGVAYKDYGGPMQFYYKGSMGYNIWPNTLLGLSYQHISNGNRYDSNPALNTYQVYFSFAF